MTARLFTPARAGVLIVVTAAVLHTLVMLDHVTMARLPQAFWQPEANAFGEIYIHFSLLPRMLVAILAGAALAFAGAIFQQLLKNPLAEPSTLGIMSGAQLAITLATLSLAGISGFQRELAGLAGGLVAAAIVVGLATRAGFAPMTLLLCGMVISFSAGSASVILSLFHHEYLRSVFIWGSGSLIQNDYGNATALAVRMIILIPLLLLFVRPLAIAGLDDAGARSLGLSPTAVRLVVLLIATVLTATVVARVGVIAFIGLGASNIARLAGARTLRQRLLWASLLGAGLLLLADGLVLVSAPSLGEVPTGTITALTGAVLMLIFLRSMPGSPTRDAPASRLNHLSPTTGRLALPICVLIAAMVAIFSLTEQFFTNSIDLSILFSGRWPRVFTSAAAGVMLALAGSVTQAITRNPMASPEGLGVSSGAGLGIILAFFLGGMASPVTPLLGGIIGATVSFGLIVLVARRRNYAPAPVLLTGVAIGAFSTAVISLIVASGDPRASYILAWTMGPTFRATGLVAIIACAIAGLGLFILPFFRRWLEVLPLGDGIATSLGIRPGLARGTLLLFAAMMTGIATMVVGPLSFLGLMAPHIARAIGRRGHVHTALTSAMIGAALMISADWLGRTVDFPYEIPAGVIAAFIGGPYFLWVICFAGGKARGVKPSRM
jgi:iron complex transport system permease protein